MSLATRYDYINSDMPNSETLAILGTLPKRWGRMDRLSRLAVVEVGRVLRESGVLESGGEAIAARGSGGLIDT